MVNCGRLLEIYPPFPLSIQKQRSQQLEVLGAAYSDKLQFKLKSLAGKFGIKSSSKKADADEMAQRLWDDSISYLAATIEDMAIEDEGAGHLPEPEVLEETIPRSVFGSPLARRKSSPAKTNTHSPLHAAPIRSSALATDFTVSDDDY